MTSLVLASYPVSIRTSKSEGRSVGSLERSMKGELISRHHDVGSSSHGTCRIVSPSSFISESLDLNPTKIDSERSSTISPHKLRSGAVTMIFLRLTEKEQLLCLKVTYHMWIAISGTPSETQLICETMVLWWSLS